MNLVFSRRRERKAASSVAETSNKRSSNNLTLNLTKVIGDFEYNLFGRKKSGGGTSFIHMGFTENETTLLRSFISRMRH